jgi:hypothetical protein
MLAEQFEIKWTKNRWGEDARGVFDKETGKLAVGPYLPHVNVVLIDLPYRNGEPEAAVQVSGENVTPYTHFIS